MIIRDTHINSLISLSLRRNHSCRSPSFLQSSVLLRVVELLVANGTAPATLRRYRQRRCQTIHVIATITVVAEQQLIVIVRGAANRTVLAFDALPSVSAHRDDHVRCELQTGRMPGAAAIRTGHQILGDVGFAILTRIAETKVTVRGRCGFVAFTVLAGWSLLDCFLGGG